MRLYDSNPSPPKSISTLTIQKYSLIHLIVTSSLLNFTYCICSTLNLVLFLCSFLYGKAYNSLPSHLLYATFPNSTLSQGQKHLSLYLYIFPKPVTGAWSLIYPQEYLIIISARTSYSKKKKKKKQQFPSSIILKTHLHPDIHDKTALHL